MDTLTTIAVVTTTVGDAEAARRLAVLAVEQRLAACVQVEPITSHYLWERRQCEDPEWRLVCKTLPGQAAQALRTWLRAHHPYDTPQLLTQEMQADRDYFQWLAQQVGA